MAHLYIVLTNSGTIPGRMVQRVTHFPYGHAMLSFTPDCDRMYSFGRRRVHSLLNGGFVEERRDGPFFTAFSDTTCQILCLNVTEAQRAEVRKQIDHFLANQQLYNYDYFGFFLRYFRMKRTFERRFVCSHFVAEMLERAGIYHFPQGVMLVRPGDFWRIPGFRCICEGKLADLPRNGEE